MPASNTQLYSSTSAAQRRQLKIVSRRRAVTKWTENDGQPDWQRLCTRHYPLQVLCAAYLHVSANAAQPRDVAPWHPVRRKEKGEKRKKSKRKVGKEGKKSLFKIVQEKLMEETIFYTISSSEVKTSNRVCPSAIWSKSYERERLGI